VSVLKRLLADRRPPADAIRPLARDERVLAWATTEAGGTVLATQLGLWLPEPDGPERIGWHLVDKAIWRAGTLTVIAAEDTGGGTLAELPPRSVRLAEPGNLPATVRARVERSIAYTRYHKLAPSGGVRVVGRRVAGRDGLTWQLVFDAGTDRDDPLLRAQADELVAGARVETGGPH
jgi:hypothetical protein